MRREERYYDVEEVLGRDTSSVFPTESKKVMIEAAKSQGIIKDGGKFISETEVGGPVRFQSCFQLSTNVRVFMLSSLVVNLVEMMNCVVARNTRTEEEHQCK